MPATPTPIIRPDLERRLHAAAIEFNRLCAAIVQQWERDAPRRDASLRADLAELHQSLARALTAPRR